MAQPAAEPARVFEAHNEDGSVTLYGQTIFTNSAALKVNTRRKISFEKHFSETPVVIITAATNCKTVHKAGDIHILSHLPNGADGIEKDGFYIISHQVHDGQVILNWIATGNT